jgi:hypothetical protein
MASPHIKLHAWCAVAAFLLVSANAFVAVRHLGTRAGRSYRWVCQETGEELSYNPSVFGSTRLSPPGAPALGRERRWELVEPQGPSPMLPWNWMAWVLDRPAPDPEAVIRQEKLRAD